MRYFLLSLLCLSFYTSTLSAQCDEPQSPEALALKAYLANSPEMWDPAVSAAQARPQTEANALALAKIAYGAVVSAMVNEDKERQNKYLDITEEAIDKVWETNDKNAAANGLYSGHLGMLIAKTPIKGMVYGGKATNYASKGIKFDAESPVANYFKGSNLFYTPTTWGGDPKEAVRYLTVAQKAFASTNCDWFQLETMALLGQAMQKTGDTEGARMVYLQALQLQPEFGYVKNFLMPQLDK